MSRILVITHFDLVGSGYLNIAVPICTGLTQLGHEVKVIGLEYDGSEHWFNFSVIPSEHLQEAVMLANNLYYLWQPDVLICALDMTWHITVMKQIMRSQMKIPYVGIMPLEAPPLTPSWAMALSQMDKVFIISKFGTEEVKKRFIDAEYLVLGMDTDTWRIPGEDEKVIIRKSLGIEEDEFVILTVADNQERKNLSKSFEIVSKFSEGKKVRYILVTRIELPPGYILADLAQYYKINDKIMMFERGMSFKQLWSLYAVADAFLLTSKAEGYGMPILEAMSVGIPVVGTNCTAIADHIGDGRGYPIDVEYEMIDPFGNQIRYMADADSAVALLSDIYYGQSNVFDHGKVIQNALQHVHSLRWENTVLQIDATVKEIENAKQKKEN